MDGEMWRAEGWRGKTMEVGRAVNQKEPEANGSIDRLIVGPETLRRYCRAQIRFKFKLSSFCCSLQNLASLLDEHYTYRLFNSLCLVYY